MWIFLISFLAAEGVQPASINYPYSSFLAYNPQKSASVHGYLRYLDNYGAGHLAGNNDPQSIYAMRQIKYINSAVPTVETTAIKDSEELTKAQETYFRAASLQQYQHLKNNIDALKAEGKQPSSEKLSKLQALEKIAFTSDFSLIAELPEVKSTLLDLQMSVSGLHRESTHQSSIESANIKQGTGEIKTYDGNAYIPAITIEETSEQKNAREDHLRIYKEQIDHLKQLELEHQKYVQETSMKLNTLQSANGNKQNDNSKALSELEKATEEHFRLWNEAKLRAEQAAYEYNERCDKKNTGKQQYAIQKFESQQVSKQIEEQNVKSSSPTLQQKHHSADQAKFSKELIPIAEQQPAADLRNIDEAILKSQEDHQAQQPVTNPNGETATFSSQSNKLKQSSPAIHYRAEQSKKEENAEIKKSHEEHLGLVQEAKLELKYKQGSLQPIVKSELKTQQQEQTYHSQIADLAKSNADHIRLMDDAQLGAYLKEENQKLSSFTQQQQLPETLISGETDEVQRAREEHLRIFNSIKSHNEQEQTKQGSRTFSHQHSDQRGILDFAIEEERLLDLERLREAERLQREHQLLELDRLREAARLAEEKREMEAELLRLRLEEEHRLDAERLLEEKRLQQEQEELKTLQNGDYQEIITQNDSSAKQDQIVIIPSASIEQTRFQDNAEITIQQNKQYPNNPFLRVGQASSETENTKVDSMQTPLNSVTSLSDNALSNLRYIQSSHHPDDSKVQHKMDDKPKQNYYGSAGYQPADTAVGLIALQKATNDHFRAHELALEQLRLARIQNPSVKDCN